METAITKQIMASNNNVNNHVVCHFYINNNRNDNNNNVEVQVKYVANNDFLRMTEISVFGTNNVAIQAVAQIFYRNQLGHGVSLQFLARYITSHLPPLPDAENTEEPNFIELQMPAINVLAAQEQEEHANGSH